MVGDIGTEQTTKINQYVLAAKLGSGSNGKVYLAHDTITDEKYAAKAIKDATHGRMGGTCMAGLEREVRIMRMLSHPNIVALHEVLDCRKTGKVYLIMEYADLGSLEGKRLSEKELASVFRQVIHAIKYLHSRGMVHHDIKPGNIMLFSNGAAKLGDFGIGHSFQSADMVIGSPAYQAPEFFDDESDSDMDLDPAKEDVWSLGVTMYEAAFGYVPYSGESIYEIARTIKNSELHFDDSISDVFRDLLQHVLCVNPAKRYGLDDILAHPFMTKWGDDLVKFNLEAEPIRMKQSRSMVQLDAEVCGSDYSFAFSRLPKVESLSWPGEHNTMTLC